MKDDGQRTSLIGSNADVTELGKDEMNLAEFPLAVIADRVPADLKTLVFEDTIDDWGTAQTITRRLTITAADKFGLPTSLDDEVILGLIQLTKQNRFTDRKVNFTRYQLIQILGWRLEGRSYERLEKSLKRWHGVTLDYEKAWWDKEAKSWVDENFHILDNVTLYDQERRLKRLRSSSTESALSSFTWNEVVFRSFKSGNLKNIDLCLFRRLNHAAAKRMYRFLDKRFYHKSLWKFHLAEFACDHIGLSRNYDTGQLKRRLQPAIEELEAAGYLKPLSSAERYVKVSRGHWEIVFVRQASASAETFVGGATTLANRLMKAGVTRSVAAELARDYPQELIELQLEVLDRLLRNEQQKQLRNPAGYLVKAIREGYAPPPQQAAPRANSHFPAARPVRKEPPADPLKLQLENYLASLSSVEKRELERLAIATAPATLANGYHRSQITGGPAFAVYQRMMLEHGARLRLHERSSVAEKQVA